MAVVSLGRADLALFADPAGTRIVIPALTAATRRRASAGALVQFEGDENPRRVLAAAAARACDVLKRARADVRASP